MTCRMKRRQVYFEISMISLCKNFIGLIWFECMQIGLRL
jgi:hypothetical protein